jgi:hypothetical protein
LPILDARTISVARSIYAPADFIPEAFGCTPRKKLTLEEHTVETHGRGANARTNISEIELDGFGDRDTAKRGAAEFPPCDSIRERTPRPLPRR